MSLNLTEKKAIVTELTEVAKASNAVVAASYMGVDAGKMTALRASATSNGVHLQIVKNTLAKKALANTDFSSIDEKLVGPLMLAFSQEEPAAAARVFRDFIKEDGIPDDMVQFLWFDGSVLEGSDLSKIANLPTKDEAISMLMSVMKAPVAKLARTIDAVKTKKEEAA